MFRPLIRLLTLAFLLTAFSPAALAEPTFLFETGTPTWKGERLELPPGFAAELGWSGVEQIRFAPGMFNADAPDFFSYLFVFLLEPGDEVDESALRREMLIYYRGLAVAVAGGKKLPLDPGDFSFSLVPSPGSTGAPLSAPAATAWSGTLKWVEPFTTQQAQTLHLELHVWEHEGQPVVLSCLSPVPPDSPDQESPWTKLREIRSKFRFLP